MKTRNLFISSAALLLISAVTAAADVDSLTLRFGGGCVAPNDGNSPGTCVFKVRAEGTDLVNEKWQLQSSTDRNGPFRFISKRIRSFDADGSAKIRIRANSACYRASTTANGNDVPDVRSNVKCF